MIIGLTGKARAGKSTVAKALNYYGFEEIAFADELKAIANRISNHTVNFRDDYIKEMPILNGKTPREFLQKLGTEFVKPYFGEDIWIKHLEMYIDSYYAFDCSGPDLNFVISDVRFEAEAEWVKSRGGKIILVQRPNHDNGITNPGHPSEQGLDKKYIDKVIVGGLPFVKDFERYLRYVVIPEVLDDFGVELNSEGGF